MEDPEVDLQGSKVELLGLKTKRSVSVTSTTTLADGSHLELHQVGLPDIVCVDSDMVVLL